MTMLNWKYKVDLQECVQLAHDGKVIDKCFEYFMKEMATDVASGLMGEPPTASVN